MHINCPHCHNGIEVVEEASLTSVDCPTCGSQFSLVSDDPYQTILASDDSLDAIERENLDRTVGGGQTTKMIGRFQLCNQVGVGAFGAVWRGRDPELDRTVAIKIPRKGQLNQAESEQFFREARAAAQLKHPNIVPVHEIGKHGETIYIVSEFVQGVSLADYLTAKTMSMRESTSLCIKVARALQHAHEKGIVHRDLKPANIMIDDQGEPHVMDFGLAKRDAGEITMTVDGQILGTPAFMSPEQARGDAHNADGRSDIYSLGVVLFQLLTGDLPFRGNTRMLLHQVLNDDPPSPTKLNSNVDRNLATISLKCMEKEPGNRYQSANDVERDLQLYLNGEPILARPIGSVERTWRWCKRNRSLSTAILASVFLLTLFAIAGPIVAFQQASLKQRAIAAKENSLVQLVAAEKAKGEAEKAKDVADDALAKAKFERERAESEKNVAIAVRSFLQSKLLRQADVFYQANTGRRVNKNLTVLEAMEFAAKEFSPENIESKFPGEPIVQAEILETIGKTFSSMNEHDSAVRFIDAAIDIRKKTAKVPLPPEILSAEIYRSCILLNASKHVRAIQTICQVVNSVGRVLDLTSKDFGQSAHDKLFNIENEIENRLDAIFDTVLTCSDPRKNTMQTFSLANDLSSSDYFRIAQSVIPTVAENEINYQRIKQRYGKDDLRTNYMLFTTALQAHGLAKIKSSLSAGLQLFANSLAGDFSSIDEAIKRYKLVIKNYQDKLPESDFRVVAAEIVLGLAYRQRGNNGDLELSLECFQKCQKALKKDLQDSHPALLMIGQHVGMALSSLNRSEEAVKCFELLAEKRRQVYGDNDRETIAIMFLLGQEIQLLSQTKNEKKERQAELEKAITCFELVSRLSKKENLLTLEEIANVEMDLADAYLQLAKFEQAANSYEKAWAYFEKNNNREYVWLLSDFCLALEHLGDDAKTAKYLKQLTSLRRRIRKRQPEDEDLLIADHLRLARVYKKLDIPESIEATLEKIDRTEIGNAEFCATVEFKGQLYNFPVLRDQGWFLNDIELEPSGNQYLITFHYQPANTRTFRLHIHADAADIDKTKNDPSRKQYRMVKSVPYSINGTKKFLTLWHSGD